MSFLLGTSARFFGGFTALSCVSNCSLLCFSSRLLGYFSFAQKVNPRLGCVRIFFSGFRRCFLWVDDWSPSIALGRAPQTPLEISPIFIGCGCRVPKIILYLILLSEFQLSYRCYCSLYSTFLFETLWLDFFCVCVCVCLWRAWCSLVLAQQFFFCWERFRFW